jgi:hypothetical protein
MTKFRPEVGLLEAVEDRRLVGEDPVAARFPVRTAGRLVPRWESMRSKSSSAGTVPGFMT